MSATRNGERRQQEAVVMDIQSAPREAEATITELDRIDVLAMVLQGRDGDHPSEFWRSRAHRLLNHREPLLAVLGLVEVQGAETCLTHIDGVLLETGSGSCDMSNDNEECRGAPLYRAQVVL